MRYSKSEVKAGIVIFAALIALLLMCAVVLKLKDLIKDRRYVIINFDKATGVTKGSNVRYAGVVKGSVTDVMHVKKEGKTRVFVVCKMDRDISFSEADEPFVSEQLTGNTWIDFRPVKGEDIEPETVTINGRKYEDAVLVYAKGPVITMDEIKREMNRLIAAAHDLLTGKERRDLRETIATAKEVFAKADKTMARIDGLVDKDVKEAIASYKKLADTAVAFVDEHKDTVAKLLKDTGEMMDEIKPRIDQTTKDWRELSADLNKFFKENKGKLDGIIASVGTAGKSFNDLMEQLSVMLGDFGDALAENRPLIKSTFQDVAEAAANFKVAVERLKRQPWLLIYRPTPAEIREIVLYDITRSLLETKATLERSAERLKQLEGPEAEGRKDIIETIEKQIQEISEQLKRIGKEVEKL